MYKNGTLQFWKWSLGEGYYKSARPEKKQVQQSHEEIGFINNDENAIQRSLYEDNEMIDITNSIFSRNNIRNSSKREDLDNKISDREMIAQRGINPFLKNSSYVSDINASDAFLKPQNTSTAEYKY